MADIVDPRTRSRMMAGIRSRNTRPEVTLRQRLHRAGLRFRLHARNLLGSPDIILPSRKIAIFVHGCFWHRHVGCHWCATPATRPEFWAAKFEGNVLRDAYATAAIQRAGWRVGIVWECGLRSPYVEEVNAKIMSWIRTGQGDFESDIVRPQGR